MDNELFEKAAALFKELDLSEISLKDNGCEIFMKKASSLCSAPQRQSDVGAAEQPAEQNISGEENVYQECNEIKAPLVGIFYAAKSPECAPFVKLGDKVKKGDVICIIEAMKMMNEVCADCDGTVFDICAENGHIVEFGQTLFKLV